jgi:hypothetical protein
MVSQERIRIEQKLNLRGKDKSDLSKKILEASKRAFTKRASNGAQNVRDYLEQVNFVQSFVPATEGDSK